MCDVQKRSSGSAAAGKPAWAWRGAGEAAALGALLLRLAAAARELCAAEPRLLRLSAPVYAIGAYIHLSTDRVVSAIQTGLVW